MRRKLQYPLMLNLTIKRIKKNFSIIRLAEITGLSRNTISNYEKGKHKPKEENLKKLADALECEISDII